MAATANTTMSFRSCDRAGYPVAASTHLYENQIAFIDPSGNLAATHNSGANKVAGICVEEADNSGAAGDLKAEVYRRGGFLLTGSGFAAGDIGKPVFAADSNTISLNAAAGPQVGHIVEVVSATKVWVAMCFEVYSPWMPTAAQQALSGAGAVNVTSYFTAVTSTGANALTLANGTRAGQLKKIQLVVDAGDATLTPTSLLGGTTITFADVGDFVILVWTGSAWAPIERGNDADGATAPAIA